MPTTIAVLGGGPAGCAAALTLRRYLPELSVVLIAMPNAEGPAVGETLAPGVLPLFEYLGVRAAFMTTGHTPAGGTLSAWGSEQVTDRSYLFTGRGTGWHLDRTQFNAWLLAQAQAVGTRHIEGRARLDGLIRADTVWRIPIEGQAPALVDAVIDATGRPAHFVRQQAEPPRRDDALIAIIRWFTHDGPAQCSEGALVETVPQGWWYSATLPRQRAVAMFMTDADLRAQADWHERLADAPATRTRMQSWHPTGESATRAAHSQCSSVVTADGWVAAGDAATAFDPVSALGIGFSLRSGMEAARVAAAWAEHDDTAATAYRDSIARIYADYRARLRGIYQQERRWPREAFWARRLG